MENTTIKEKLKLLPGLDCGACGYKTFADFAAMVASGTDDLKECIHVADKLEDNNNISKDCFICAKEGFAWATNWVGKIISEEILILSWTAFPMNLVQKKQFCLIIRHWLKNWQ